MEHAVQRGVVDMDISAGAVLKELSSWTVLIWIYSQM
jgi:hypothetical protein